MQGKIKNDRAAARMRRQKRIRKKVAGTQSRPRLAVFRSLKHTYVQVIDDGTGTTLAAASTVEAAIRTESSDKKSEAARKIGQLAAARCIEKGITDVVFDRGGYPYHGRIAAVASGAREGGLNF